jgi:predicted dehydrogenase
MAKRKMRMGMIGGGRGAFIGAVHRMAAALDGEIELVCGAFSSDPEKSKATGSDLFLPAERAYASYDEMFSEEAKLPVGERMDFVSIVTPNFMHFDPAAKALKNGFSVVLDKPMTLDLNEALQLRDLVNETGQIFALTHTYTGYPMVKQARAMIAEGTIGEVRKIHVEYPQGWLSSKLEDTDNKQAGWRTDPSKSGLGGALGDIGTHAENLAETVSGLHVTEVSANVNIVVPGRQLDDDVDVLLRYDNGASGTLTASQVLAGSENNLKICIYGENGGLEWKHAAPNSLLWRKPGAPVQELRAGVDLSYLAPITLKHCRTPSGHPEGFLEAFANIYRNFARTLSAKLDGESIDPDYSDFPGAEDGVRGMTFIQKAIESSQNGGAWTPFE